MVSIKSPCLGCNKRHTNCHSKCVKYTAFRLCVEHQRELKAKAREEETFVRDVKRKHIHRLQMKDKTSYGRKK